MGHPTKEWLDENALANVDAHIVNVTPDMAREWLRNNTGNRAFRATHARSIAEEMRRGEWRLTHQGIAFSTRGRLLDGQHRLAAIADAGVTVPLLVFVDADEGGFAMFDRGRRRDTADVLLRDPRHVSIALTLLRLAFRGGGTNARRPTPGEAEAVIDAYDSDIQAQHDASTATRHSRTISPIRGVWLVRHHAATPAQQVLLRTQWRAFASLDHASMDASTAAGDRRLDNFRAIRGGALEVEAACIGWQMFDPARRDLTRVKINDSTGPLNEIREALLAAVPLLTKTAVPEAPFGDGTSPEGEAPSFINAMRAKPGARGAASV